MIYYISWISLRLISLRAPFKSTPKYFTKGIFKYTFQLKVSHFLHDSKLCRKVFLSWKLIWLFLTSCTLLWKRKVYSRIGWARGNERVSFIRKFDKPLRFVANFQIHFFILVHSEILLNLVYVFGEGDCSKGCLAKFSFIFIELSVELKRLMSPELLWR